MAFQDFDYLSERRKAEKSKRLKKRIAVAAMSTLILGVVIAVAVLCIIRTSDKNASDSKTTSSKASPDEASDSTEDASAGSSKDASSGSSKDASSDSSKDAPSDSSKDASSDSSNNATAAAAAALKTADLAAKTLCAATDFEDACNKAMGKVDKNESSDNKTNNVVKVAIKANTEEVKTSFGKVESLNFESKEEKAAFEDCKELLQDAMDELSSATTEATGDVTKIPSKSGDLNNWLSAVMSYQQTCIDGFPDGKLKTELEKTLKTAKELTSNSLAITTKVSSFGQDEDKAGARRLLSNGAPNHPVNDLDKDGFPRWLFDGDRRMLKNNKEDMPTPNVTVAKDGSGKFKTINEALSAMPKTYKDRYVIYVKAGIYDETVIITKKMTNVTLFGDGSQKSVITGNKNFVDGVRTFQTASFAALGEGFIGRAMGFRNTAGPEKHQAVAARVQADKAIFLNCRFEGYQDTLYVQTHRQYYRACVIIGTIDFIFGDAAAVFQNCEIIVRKPLDNQQNIVTAQGRVDKRETTGIVIQNCRIEADPTLVPVKAKIKSYLGRPWKEYSRTVIMESTIDDLIQPEGWLPWEGEFALKTLYYAEYNNKGAGASLTSRVSWAGYQKKFKRADAQKFAIGTFLESEWIKEAKIPVKVGLYY